MTPEIGAGVFERPQTGFFQSVYQDYIAPFGAPQSATEALGDFAPGASDPSGV